MNWKELCQDPRWQKKRLEILNRDNWRCRNCGADGKTLSVHHRYYEKGLRPWEYDDDALVTLCMICHENWHHLKSQLDRKTPYLIAELEWLIRCAEHGPMREIEHSFNKNIKVAKPIISWLKEEALRGNSKIDSQVVDCCLYLEESMEDML